MTTLAEEKATMINSNDRDRLLRRLDELPPHLQARVADFAETLALAQKKGTSGADAVAGVAGILPEEDAAQMRAAIEEEFEQIDAREW